MLVIPLPDEPFVVVEVLSHNSSAHSLGTLRASSKVYVDITPFVIYTVFKYMHYSS